MQADPCNQLGSQVSPSPERSGVQLLVLNLNQDQQRIFQQQLLKWLNPQAQGEG